MTCISKIAAAPWQAVEVCAGRWIVVGAKDEILTSFAMPGQTGPYFDEDTARLIAAAPKLLTVAREALATIGGTLAARGYAEGECTDAWAGEVRAEVATRARLRAVLAPLLSLVAP